MKENLTILSMILLVAPSSAQLEIIFETIGDQLRDIRQSIVGPRIQDIKFDKDIEEYDFIIVGAGSSGAVLAARLSEISNWKILLLEAGPPESLLGQIPAIGPVMVTTQHGWNYKTVPQRFGCKGKINKQCAVRTGRGLGGGSSINGIVYSRGDPEDYNRWSALGNPGWSYNEVLPYFKRAENCALDFCHPKFRGKGGPLNVEEPRLVTKEITAFIEAAQYLFFKNIDINAESPDGVSMTQFISRGGRRTSTSSSYLQPLHNRENLIIKTYSRATKIIFNNKIAVGVRYIRNKKHLVAMARMEVIISCGALNSPQLLMVSGIGPRKDLRKLNINVIQDLKVGYNFLDHISFTGLNFYYTHKAKENNLQNGLNWFLYGNGTLASGGVDAMAFVRTKSSLRPDIELMLIPTAFNQGYHTLGYILNLEKSNYNSVWGPKEGKEGYSFLVQLSQSKSTGRVKIQSNDTSVPPLIDPNYLSNPDDVETLISGIEIALSFAKSPSFEKLGARLNALKVSGCESYEFGTRDYWRCAVPRQHLSAAHHQGTCKMGPSTDKAAVVNVNLQVYGVERLRVVDASVMPVALTGHLEAPVVMVAEKTADIIKDEWMEK